MPDIPAEAVTAALAARADLLADRPDPTVLSDQALTRKMLEAALPAIERDIRSRIAESLRRAAAGHREYAEILRNEEAGLLLKRAANIHELSAAIIEDPANLLDQIPSWRWTDEERASVREGDGPRENRQP